MKILLLLYLSLTSFTFIKAQAPPIQTDRPDQTECPFITPMGYIQIENGFYANLIRLQQEK